MLYNEVGIKAQGNFIFGDEAETVETAENTIKWWREHPQYSIRNALIILYPGSVLYQNACKRGIIKDEVQFIKDGCPITNVSKMTDAEYRDMALKLSMLPQTRTDVLEDASAEYIGNGRVDFTARCPQCGQKNTWKTLEPFRILSNLFCEHCGRMVHCIVADSIGHNAEDNFQLLKDHDVAIWPMTNVVEEMRRAVPSIMGDNVYFIDSAELKQGAHFYKKVVQSPNVIVEKKIDTVFLATSSVIATEIIETLKGFPSVKHVFFAGDLFDPDFPNQYKREFSSPETDASRILAQANAVTQVSHQPSTPGGEG